jgi:BirA family biotin operon repressor/biotin-[acetyl-CoA-carboxylase] ligase
MTLSLIARLPVAESTNTLLAQMLEEAGGPGSCLPTALIFADEQTGGRGRGGNPWLSPKGGLYFSLLFRSDPLPPFIPLTAGLYLARWLAGVSGCRVTVRWPNDLMMGERKLAGILAESKASGVCILGVGVNVNAYIPVAPDRDPVSLQECQGKSIPLGGLRSEVEHFVSGDFIPYLLEGANLRRWPEYTYFAPGQVLACRSGKKEIRGLYRGITDQGYLKVESGGRVLELPSAEEVRPA